MKPPFPGPYGRRYQFLAKAGEWFAPRLCPSSDIDSDVISHGRRFIHADDICCALQVETFCELECTLAADLARHCQLWHPKPSTSKTDKCFPFQHSASESRRTLGRESSTVCNRGDQQVYGIGGSTEWCNLRRSACMTTCHIVNWMFTWMVNVWSTTATQCILVSLQIWPFHTGNTCHVVQRSYRAGTTWSRNSLVLYGVPAQAPSAHQPWLYATQSQNTAVQCGLDPATQVSSTPNSIIQCAWFQAACNPRSSHGCQCSAVLHLLLYVVKRQLAIWFKSSKPIQIGCIC